MDLWYYFIVWGTQKQRGYPVPFFFTVLGNSLKMLYSLAQEADPSSVIKLSFEGLISSNEMYENIRKSKCVQAEFKSEEQDTECPWCLVGYHCTMEIRRRLQWRTWMSWLYHPIHPSHSRTSQIGWSVQRFAGSLAIFLCWLSVFPHQDALHQSLHLASLHLTWAS